MRSEIKKRIEENVTRLSKEKQLQFLFIIAHLKLKYYHRFCKQNHFGNRAVMKQAVVEVQKVMLMPNMAYSQTIEKLISKIKRNIPDTEEFGGFDAQLALDACVCLLNTFEFIKTDQPKYLFQSIESTLDMAQLFIELEGNLSVHDPELEQKVFADQLMKRQIKGLNELVNELSKNTKMENLLRKRKFIVTYNI